MASYVDVNQLFDSSVSGTEAFGGLSQQMQGADLKPALTYDTRLSDLHHGTGVTLGSIRISDGQNNYSTIDLTSAQTIGDVATLIRSHAPSNRTLNVEVSGEGLVIRLIPDTSVPPKYPSSQDNLSVTDVSGGRTASDLGIAQPRGVGAGPLYGDSLDPALRLTTAVSDLLGTRSQGFLRLAGANNDILFEAKAAGSQLDGVTITMAADGPADGHPTVDFDQATSTLTVHAQLYKTTTQQILDAVNNTYGIPFAARLDPTDIGVGASGTIILLPEDGLTEGGSSAIAGGGDFDPFSGIQIVNGGKTYTVDFSSAQTVQDMLNAVQLSGAGVLAEINEEGTGLDFRSIISGADFAIGENGGSTASQLGLRSLDEENQTGRLELRPPSGTFHRRKRPLRLHRLPDRAIRCHQSGDHHDRARHRSGRVGSACRPDAERR